MMVIKPKTELLMLVGSSSVVKTAKRAKPAEAAILPRVTKTIRKLEDSGTREMSRRETPQLNNHQGGKKI